MSGELRPCPFCGSPPLVENKGVVGGGWHIRCICIHAPGLCDQRREVAVELWNQRAPDSAAPAEEFEKLVEAYREALRAEVSCERWECEDMRKDAVAARAALLDHERRLRERVAELERKVSHPRFLDEALNSGDGSYKP